MLCIRTSHAALVRPSPFWATGLYVVDLQFVDLCVSSVDEFGNNGTLKINGFEVLQRTFHFKVPNLR